MHDFIAIVILLNISITFLQIFDEIKAYAAVLGVIELVTMVKRGNKNICPQGSTLLAEEDIVLMLEKR